MVTANFPSHAVGRNFPGWYDADLFVQN